MNQKHNFNVGSTNELSLRVSVATCNRVLFPHPQDGAWMLALERRATARRYGEDDVRVWSQPFGGAVRIFDPAPLQGMVGELQFDSARSQREQDFRIQIRPSQWEQVKEYCLSHLGTQEDLQIESSPDRELTEEFAETIDVSLKSDQYKVQPLGFVVENNPVRSDNIHARGQPTVRVYRIFDVRITDAALCGTMLAVHQQYTDQELGACALRDAENGGRGRVNSILTLPLERVIDTWLELPPEMRYRKIKVEGHELDESMLAVLWDIEVPQYERI
ncbi:MAG TPA: hypothetical protein VJ785_04560 [Anaerolineales bacterium]|nr:hypothetical protein [Anaerolineales bacterium]